MTRPTDHVLVLLLLAAASVSTAAAQSLRPVQPIPGYVCAKLDVTEAEALDRRPGAGVPIRTAPDTRAPVDTLAASVLFLRQPVHEVGGFVEVLQLNGRPGWIEKARVKPFDPMTRCVPSTMTNGRPGIG